MKRIPPSTQMQEALRTDLIAGFAGHPLRQFVRRAAELLLQVGLEEVVTSVLGRNAGRVMRDVADSVECR